MKKCVVTLVGALMCASTALHAHDFMVDGIAYNILSPTQVEVTYKGSEVDEAPLCRGRENPCIGHERRRHLSSDKTGQELL